MTVFRTRAPSGLPAILGVSQSATAAGVRYPDRDDLTLFRLVEGTRIGGVFTRSSLPGLPVLWNRSLARRGRARAIICVAGNANVHTGTKGAAAHRLWVESTAHTLGCEPRDIWVAATGVIGEVPSGTRVARALPALAQTCGPRNWSRAARAIWTTDLAPKATAAQVRMGRDSVRIAGISKGSGMIAPNMATTLSFLFTDAALSPPVIRSLLRECVADTFNLIDIDGFPSTSDMVLLAATGMRMSQPIVDTNDPRLRAFRQSLHACLEELSMGVVGDAEGISRLIRLEVSGARTDTEARRVVRALALSPLVRTIFAGDDPNWGRVICVLGATVPRLDAHSIVISFDDCVVSRNGVPPDARTYTRARAVMRRKRYTLSVRLGRGRGRAHLYTSDLSSAYLKINASYLS